MRKLGIVPVILLCSLALVACQKEAASNVQSGETTMPTTSQTVLESITMTVRRPAHDLQNFTEIVGWYDYEYSDNSRYPSRVVRTDLDGNVEESYELHFDEDGIPIEMTLRNIKGEVSPYWAELYCDDHGNIQEVRILDEEYIMVTRYWLTYDENNRMVAAQKTKENLIVTLNYDERYHLTYALWCSGATKVEVELGYGEDHQLTKRLIIDETGAASGMDTAYDDAGVLREYYWYEEDVVVKERHYNERGQLTSERHRSADGSRESKILQEYDQEGRVSKVTLEEDGELVSWTELSYQGLQYFSVTYDAQGNVTGRDHTETDEDNRVIKKITYGDHDNVLEHHEYTYNAQGEVVREKNYTYKEEGTLSRGEEIAYDDQGRRISYFAYSQYGLLQGYEKVQDEAGNIIEEIRYQMDGSYAVKKYITGTQLVDYEVMYSAEGESISSAAYTYEGEILRYSIWHREDGSTEETYFDENGNSTLRVIYGKNGEELFRNEWTYHDNRRMATFREYESGKIAIFWQKNEEGEKVKEIRYNENGDVVSTSTWEYIHYTSGRVFKAICTTVSEETIITETVYYPNGRRQSVRNYAEDGTLLDATYYDVEGNEL